jgi:hypothetical protein
MSDDTADKNNNKSSTQEHDPIVAIPLRPPAFDLKKSQSRLAHVDRDSTLEYRCQAVVVAHLERYPAAIMGMLSEPAWDSIVKMRHERTAPHKGKRRTPAMSQPFLAAVEEENPHLAESSVADKLVWKDCAELKFPTTNSLGRPRGLLYPWPVCVQRVTKAGSDLMDLYLNNSETDDVTEKEKHLLERAVQVLTDAPMNIPLLQQTGIGKTVKKFIKASGGKRKEKASSLGMFTERRVVSSFSKSNGKVRSLVEQLEELLLSWKTMAAKSGAAVHENMDKTRASVEEDDDIKTAKDMDRAERSCRTWRELFHLLQRRETKRRANQGARMRESRRRLAQNQPKIVKVRPAKAKHDAILHRPVGAKFASSSSSSSSPPKNKMMALREESKVAATWQKGGAKSAGCGSSFGNAVAFAGVGKSARRLGAGKTVALKGGKRMRVPTKISADALKKKLSKPAMRRMI